MNKDMIAVFVDLETAYDKVWRQGLFINMRDAGMHSNMYRWIKNFLTDRTIATQTELDTQTKECLKEGIPQGNSLSCIRYTLYINDIVKYLQDRNAALYGDDIVHVWCGRQAHLKLQRTEMAMLIWTGKPINSSLRTAM